MAAEDTDAGAAEADDGGGEAAAVLAGDEREEDVLGPLDGGTEVAENRGAGGGGSAGEDDEVRRAGQAGEFLAPAEEAGASWIRTRSGAQAVMTRARASVSSRIERML